MKHVLKIVDTGKLDIAFASQLCNALGESSGVKANATKEIILDRNSQQEAKKGAFPGLKKMHHRKYRYDKQRNFTALVVFENSFSSGNGISYDTDRLKKMMSKNKFQVEPATVVVLGIQNAAKVVCVDDKAERDANLELKRQGVANTKAKQLCEAIPKAISNATYPCPENNCTRIFLKAKWLEKHVASKNCKLSKSHRRQSRSKKIVTRKNSLPDMAIKKVADGNFHEFITLVKPKASTVPEYQIHERKKRYKLCNGQRWVPNLLSRGYARKMRWSSRTKYTTKQLEFLRWAFSLGQKNINRKLTSEKAAEVMGLVGTADGEKRFPEENYMKCSADGQPMFLRSELIEKYEIKSFFSRTKTEIMKQLGSK